MTAHTPGRVHGLHMTPEQLSFGDKLRPHRTPRALVPPRAFHVSSPRTTVDEAREGERRAAGQEQVILALLRLHAGESFTPSEVANHVNCGRDRAWPVTSIRARLTTLTQRGLLRRTNERRMGPLGSPEHAWSLAE